MISNNNNIDTVEGFCSTLSTFKSMARHFSSPNPPTIAALVSPASVNLYQKTPRTILAKSAQSWDPTLVNPCTWFHVTCNNDNSVIRVDLRNAALSGQLVPRLGLLKNLQYLYVMLHDFNII
ncbi:hypothetical protein Q3G72_025610 [Acer saccharum]|nr:hypothetical protein Q3G72_025610 [Acer saccharum]